MAVAITCVLAVWPAAACSRTATPGYGKARFGMTPEEVLTAYGLTRAEATEDLYGEKLEWFLPARAGDGETLNLTFFQHPTRHRFELCCVNATSQAGFDETVGRLTRLYGAPTRLNRRPDGGAALWRREGMVLEVSATGQSVFIRAERPRS